MVSMRAMREPAVLMRCGITFVGSAVIVFAAGCTMTLSRSEAILYLIATGVLLAIGIAAIAYGIYRLRKKTAPSINTSVAPAQSAEGSEEVPEQTGNK